MSFVRTMMDASIRLTIVDRDSSIVITDAEGASMTLQTDNKKREERAENGLVKLTKKSQWNLSTLTVELDIENGPTIIRKYELSQEGGELHVSTTISGGFGGRGGGGNRAVTHVYERPDAR